MKGPVWLVERMETILTLTWSMNTNWMVIKKWPNKSEANTSYHYSVYLPIRSEFRILKLPSGTWYVLLYTV
jgi:hypothetical protein